MSLSLTQQIKTTFDLASLRYEASKNLTADEWKTYQDIRKRAEAERRYAERVYRNEYETRIESARAELLRSAGAKTDDLKPRFTGVDRFDKAGLTRQAHRQVQNRHHLDLAQCDQREQSAITALLTQAEKRQIKTSPERDTYNNDKTKMIEMPSIFKSRSRSR